MGRRGFSLIVGCLDGLQAGAAQFTTHARELKRKYWWKNVKVSRVLKRKQKKKSFNHPIDLDVGYFNPCDCKYLMY